MMPEAQAGDSTVLELSRADVEAVREVEALADEFEVDSQNETENETRTRDIISDMEKVVADITKKIPPSSAFDKRQAISAASQSLAILAGEIEIALGVRDAIARAKNAGLAACQDSEATSGENPDAGLVDSSDGATEEGQNIKDDHGGGIGALQGEGSHISSEAGSEDGDEDLSDDFHGATLEDLEIASAENLSGLRRKLAAMGYDVFALEASLTRHKHPKAGAKLWNDWLQEVGGTGVVHGGSGNSAATRA